jgi:septum site-determining protein MinC
MTGDTLQLPRIKVRGRSFMALIVTPEFPLSAWFAALDQQMAASREFFDGRPVVVDLTDPSAREGGRAAAVSALEGLAARRLRLVGVEGVEAGLLAGTRWVDMPTSLHGRDVKREIPDGTVDSKAVVETPVAAPSLLIDRPVRSGQAIAFEDGDIIVVGSVASGAEVIAGGSIHIYGALRGRAIAGLTTGAGARIFCRKLEAEMVAVDRRYRTAEHWGADLHGQPVQVRCDRGALSLSLLD